MPYNGQHFLKWIVLCGGQLPISSMVCTSKCSLGIRSTCIGQSPSLLYLWHCGWPLMPEAFFDGVQDFLSNALFQSLFAATLPGQLLQMIDVPAELCYILLGGVRADDLHGNWLHHQVSFHWWFPSALMDCMVMLAAAGGSGMEKHLLK